MLPPWSLLPPPEVLPPEVDEVEAPPHELDVVDDVDELDDEELDPCCPPAPLQPPPELDQPPEVLPKPFEESPEWAPAGLTTSRPARTVATVVIGFMGFPLMYLASFRPEKLSG